MKILGIDTSSKFLSIAVSEDKDIISEQSHLLDRTHASMTVPKIKGLLKKLKIPLNKIDAFVIGIGPGSFTGLRIGVSTVKGFGIATEKPCIGVPSIDAVSLNVKGGHDNIIPVIDAKREQLYSAIYSKKGDNIIRKSDYLLLPVAKLMKMIKKEAVFLGDGISLYRTNIEKANKSAIFLDEKYWYPNAGNLIKLGYTKIKKTKGADLDKLVPMYMYPEDCQVKRDG